MAHPSFLWAPRAMVPWSQVPRGYGALVPGPEGLWSLAPMGPRGYGSPLVPGPKGLWSLGPRAQVTMVTWSLGPRGYGPLVPGPKGLWSLGPSVQGVDGNSQWGNSPVLRVLGQQLLGPRALGPGTREQQPLGGTREPHPGPESLGPGSGNNSPSGPRGIGE